ncbi:rCG59447 [Rattus norvegicus]|uniref:RCG59447 n=1 Tax=Rattus norvegicus TaxID=10116 RepID=A6HS50_RAT|nr:rCG59447 [Rattus norvegicus]
MDPSTTPPSSKRLA